MKPRLFNNQCWQIVSFFMLLMLSSCAADREITTPSFISSPSCKTTPGSTCTASNADHSLTIDEMGNVWAQGGNDYGQLGLGFSSQPVTRATQIPLLKDIVEVHVTGLTSFAINSTGALFAWGQNDQCQLGTGTKINQLSPTSIFTIGIDPSVNIWQQTSSGTQHTLEIRADGSLYAQGANDKGQLGQGNKNPYSGPVQVMKGTTFNSVYAVKDSSFAITTEGNLYVWGTSRFEYIGPTQKYNNTILKPSILTGIGKIQIIDIWDQNNDVPVTPYLPLNAGDAIVKLLTNTNGGKVQKADGSIWEWGGASGSCFPHQINQASIDEFQSIATTQNTTSAAEPGITLQITNSEPYYGEPITLQANVDYKKFKDIWFSYNDYTISNCTFPEFDNNPAANKCTFNNFLNMDAVIQNPIKPTTLQEFTDKYQKTVALTKFKVPNTPGKFDLYACGTLSATGNTVCSPVQTIQAKELVCQATEYDWEIYNPGQWGMTNKQINDAFSWGEITTAEKTDQDLTQGIVNYLGRQLSDLTNAISLDSSDVIRTISPINDIDWLPEGQTFLWNPIHRVWATTTITAGGKVCFTHVSKGNNLNFRTDPRGTEDIFTNGFEIPAARHPGQQNITASAIYHVTVSGKRPITLYISTSQNFKWTYWIAGNTMGRGAPSPYNFYVGYTWNGLISKIHTTRADQAEITVPHEIPGHNMMGSYEIKVLPNGKFEITNFTLNPGFYPQTVDNIPTTVP